jgi:hypothetical protein
MLRSFCSSFTSTSIGLERYFFAMLDIVAKGGLRLCDPADGNG